MDQPHQPPRPAIAWIAQYRKPLLIGGPVAAALVLAAVYLLGGRYVSTDDAYIQSARVEISANVPGRLTELYVQDNQLVKAGDILFRLDQRRFDVAVREAEAQLAAARLKVQSLQATYRQQLADQAAASGTLNFQQSNHQRQIKLQETGIASAAQLEQSAHELASARQRLAAAREQSASALAALNGMADGALDSQPMVKQAQAALDRANLELADATVRAPMDGVVTRVERIQVGDYIQAATPLFALVSAQKVWLEANFKETDLTHIRPGQSASFTLDTYPGRKFTAKVQSVSPGTGSSFSLLPPENSSGNWVKVVQRLPVRLTIENRPDTIVFGAGMSATVRVDTGESGK